MKNLGIGATSLTLLGAGTAGAETGTDGQFNDEDGGEVEPQWMTGTTCRFNPYEISVYDDSTLQSSWHFQTVPPIPANNYQIDILVSSDNVYRPDTVSTNVSSGDITKDWEYRSSSPVGSAYHWQAKLWVADVFGATRYVDADIDSYSTGEVEAKTGTFWPWQSWSTGYLDIS